MANMHVLIVQQPCKCMQVGDALLELEGGSAGEDAIEAQNIAHSNSGASSNSSPNSSSD